MAPKNYSLEGLVFTSLKPLSLNLTPEEEAFIKAHSVIRMGNDRSWPPFEYIDDENRHQGMAADYLNLVGEKLGIRFTPQTHLTWAEVTEAAQKQEVDIFSCAVATPKRREYMAFTTPYLSFPMVIATTDRVAYIRGTDDLAGRAVGVVKGYISHEMLTTRYPQISVITFDSVAEGLSALG